MIELYAITDSPPADLTGLTAVRGDGLYALCATVAADPEVNAGVLWQHEEVVERLMEQCDLLPVRYGTRVEDERAAERVLFERHAELVGALERVRGAVELSVRVFSEEARNDLEVRASIHGPLAMLARGSVAHSGRDAREVMREAYLVDRGDVESFVSRVVELEASNPRLRLLCTGPWPPYSFTGG